MDKKLAETIAQLDPITALTLRSEIAWAALEAVIASHPNRAALREQFDRSLAQFQTSASMLAAPEGVRDLVRALVQQLFQDTQ